MSFRTLLSSVLAASLGLLFAAAPPASADASHARIIRLSLVQGDVRFARDVHGDPLTSDKAVWEGATLNLPIRQGYVLATDQGRAEVEFENGAMAFLAGNTVLEFYDLSLEDGAKTTRLVLRQGTASFYVNPSSEDYFSVTGGDFTVEADGRAGFRLDDFDDGSEVKVTKGRVSVLRKKQTSALVKGQSLSMRAGDNASVKIERLPDSDDFDRWVSGREEAVVTATTAGQQYVNSSYYTSGIADLYTYGSFYPIGGYGNCWRPYGVGLGWSPFDSGGWFNDPFYGMGFIGSQPWGWLPYHYGGWIFEPGFGWLWSPGLGFGGFNGFVPFRPVTGVFVRSNSGLLGLVPVHPLDVRGKEPINLTKGIFPVNAGTVSSSAMAATNASWKALKTAPRDALTASAVSASVAPARVSRTVLQGNAGARVVTLDRNSSIAYDPREHRFVNTASEPAASGKIGDKAGAEQARTGSEPAARVGAAGQNVASARTVGVPSAGRAASAPPRAMTPPPAPRSSAYGGSERVESGRGGGGSSSASASHSSAASASHPSSGGGGGKPH
jgi:FecR protein